MRKREKIAPVSLSLFLFPRPSLSLSLSSVGLCNKSGKERKNISQSKCGVDRERERENKSEEEREKQFFVACEPSQRSLGACIEENWKEEEEKNELVQKVSLTFAKSFPVFASLRRIFLNVKKR